MGVFKKRGNWWIDYKGQDGKRHRELVGNSHKLAKDVEQRRKTEAMERRYFPERSKRSQKFQVLIDKYFELHGSNLRSKSWDAMRHRVEERFGDMQTSGITTAVVQAFYNTIEASGTSSTANRYLTLVKVIFNRAKDWGEFYGDNPCNAVRKKREPNHRLRYLSVDEIKRLVYVADARLKPILICALSTGMRKGELLKLDWRDVDFLSGTLQLLETKSGKSRKIPMMGSLRNMLLKMPPKEAGLVFELPEISLRRFFAKALADARITEFRFHDLRHTFASHFAMTTGDLPTLQQLLGHATVQMTMRYAHLSDQHLAEKMSKLEGSLPALTYSPEQSELPRRSDVYERNSVSH